MSRPTTRSARPGAARRPLALARSAARASSATVVESACPKARPKPIATRPSQQALWLGFRSKWLLQNCRFEDAIASQEAGIGQAEAATEAGRLSKTDLIRYKGQLAEYLDDARTRVADEDAVSGHG